MKALQQTEATDTEQQGTLLLNANNLTLQWCGLTPAPRLGSCERIRIALGYMWSKGHGPILSRLSWRLIKAVISLWKSPQVLSLSGKEIVTKGLSFEDEWTSFNTTLCGHPHTLQGTEEAWEASRSS